MRGKGADHLRSEVCLGITPACAGKSLLARTSSACPWDHPRVCGDKRQRLVPQTARKGSPPRMRGKVNQHVHDELRLGITPACAGKRRQPVHRATPRQDHPRVCGEKKQPLSCLPDGRGSPPRMRGKANSDGSTNTFLGITPAYAGKSLLSEVKLMYQWDHPRVCGEKVVPDGFCYGVPGSPPRMRGKARHGPQALSKLGITPAYAGKRRTGSFCEYRSWDHPRVCGEKQRSPSRMAQRGGSPPRMRGKAGCSGWSIGAARITPAYAGKSAGGL